MAKTFLVMAGGTGGHVFPALAVARELMSRGHQVQWLGTARGIEAQLVPAAGIPLNIIPIEGVRGRGILGLVKAPLLIVKAVLMARAIIRTQKIDGVIGFGGFASGPGALAAWTLGKPVVTHEQNAVAGTTNRLSANFAKKILVAFEGAYKKPGLSARAQVVGNPVRAEICQLPAPEARVTSHSPRELRLLVLGGSLGAQAINQLIPEALALIDSDCALRVRHQTGRQHGETTDNLYRARAPGKAVAVEPFIADMAEAYAWADLVICRAGALTVSELMAAGVGALLIPLPHAIDDHQTANAMILQRAGAGQVLAQSEITKESLARLIQQQFFTHAKGVNQAALIAMGEAARRLAVVQSAQLVADACEEILSGHN